MPQGLTRFEIETAEAAVAFAAQVRRYHRRRTAKDSGQRRNDLELARERLREAMAPVKSELGRGQYGAQTTAAELNRDRVKALSAALQNERRKIWKMQNHKEDNAT